MGLNFHLNQFQLPPSEFKLFSESLIILRDFISILLQLFYLIVARFIVKSRSDRKLNRFVDAGCL